MSGLGHKPTLPPWRTVTKGYFGGCSQSLVIEKRLMR